MKKIISLLVGIACIAIGVFILITYFTNQKTQTVGTTATIIRVDSEVQQDEDGFDTRYYYPVIEYKVDDKTYENRLPDSGTTNSAQYKINETVEIKYNPDNPNELSKEGSKGGLIGGIFFIVFGIISLISIIKM